MSSLANFTTHARQRVELRLGVLSEADLQQLFARSRPASLLDLFLFHAYYSPDVCFRVSRFRGKRVLLVVDSNCVVLTVRTRRRK